MNIINQAISTIIQVWWPIPIIILFILLIYLNSKKKYFYLFLLALIPIVNIFTMIGSIMLYSMIIEEKVKNKYEINSKKVNNIKQEEKDIDCFICEKKFIPSLYNLQFIKPICPSCIKNVALDTNNKI